MYVWNAIAYDLTTPLELMHTGAWKDFVVIAECVLYLLEFLKNGGKLRQLAGQSIDEVKDQRGAAPAGKTVNFKFENESGQDIEGIAHAQEAAAPQ